jgi:serine/threonine-protein kinase RsbW
MSTDQVTLSVPARSEYARTVRMAAAELAARMGMSYDEVDDVRMAVEEAFVYACDCAGEDQQVTFAFFLSDGELSVIVGPLPQPEESEGSAAENYAEFILRSVCDEFAIEREGSACTLRLTRRIGTEPEGAGE